MNTMFLLPAIRTLCLLCLTVLTIASTAVIVNASEAELSSEASSEASSEVRSSLKKHKYPWYNSSTGEFKPVSDIPEEKKKKQPANSSLDFKLIDVVMRVLFWTLVIVVAVWMTVLLVRAFMDIPEKEKKPTADMPVVSQERLDLLPEITRGVTDFLSEAQKQARLGDFSRAMIFYYSWQLLMLGDQEVIELESGKTNRQYLREASQSRPDLRELFALSIRMFEEAIYGGITLDAADFQGIWTQREIIRNRSSARRKT